MRRVVTLAVVVVVCALAAIVAGAGRQPAGATPPQLQPVLVTLADQADLSGISGTPAQRLREVIRRRRALALLRERPFAGLVREWWSEGKVSEFRPLWIFNGFALRATQDVIDTLSSMPGVASVRPDATMSAAALAPAGGSPEPNLSVINAPALWSLGYTGQGLVVGSLDTGVDVTHPDLAGSWRGGSDSWFDPFGQHLVVPTDMNGHGTQVMGVMVGGSTGGTAVGVAPAARWIAARIFNDRGQGSISATHLAFQWLLDPDGNPATADAPNVVDNSWASTAGCSLEFEPDIQVLRAAGILPIFGAGNYDTLSASPANNPGAFAVGSTTLADVLATGSSLGPTTCGQPSATFPQLTAPGVDIRTTDLYAGYTTQSGTSLAAPHVAGGLALLLSAHPGLSVSQQETALEGSARDLGPPGPDNTYGYGRLDLLAAYNLTTTPDFSLDVSPTPATTTPGGTASYTIRVTPTNGFHGDVSLTVSGMPGGATATLSASVVAGGTGTAQLDVATSPALALGSYPFSVTGQSGTLTHTAAPTLVVAPPPDFALTVAPPTATTASGGVVTFTVGVSAVSGFSGTVDLSLSGLAAGQGSWSFSPASVAGGSGSTQLTITTAAALPVGSYPLTVTGTSGALGHSAGATLVIAPPGDFAVSATPASAGTIPGGGASYTVSVAPVNGFASDVVLSLSGLSATQATWTFAPATVAGASGSSQLTVTTAASLAVGSYPLRVTGTSGALVHGVDLTLVVSPPPDFTLGATPASVTVNPGGHATYAITVSSQNGFAGAVALSLGGLPAGQATATFTPSTVNGGAGSSQLVVTTTASIPPGTYPLSVSGTSGARVHAAPVTLVVAAPPDFTLKASPAAVTARRSGPGASSMITVGSTGGFTGVVRLSVSGLPSGVQSSLSRSSVTAPGTANLTLTARSTARTGTFTITVTGTSGSKVHTTTIALTVT